MKNKQIILTGLIAALMPLMLMAQEKKQITLFDAIDMSLKNSHELKASGAQVLEASAAVREAKDKKLPSASVSASYLRLNSANIKMKSEPDSSGGGGGAPKVNSAMYGLLNASLPIYAGGRIRYGIESAKYLEQATKLDAKEDKEAVIQNTIEAFSNLYKANTAVSLVKENLVQAEQRVKDFTNLEKNGLLARNDLLKAQLQSSNAELSLLDAQNNSAVANVNMDLMLGLPTNTELDLNIDGLGKSNDERALPEYLQAATTNRKDLEALALRKKAADLGVKAIRAEMLPSLQVSGGYVALDVPKFISVTNAVNIGVGVSYNIASLWNNKAKVQQAEAKATQIYEQQASMDDNIRLQVNKSYLALVSLRKKMQVLETSIQQAEENYRITKNKFDNSLATTTDLLDAEVAQLQAKLSYSSAQADAFVAYHKLLQVTGTLGETLKK